MFHRLSKRQTHKTVLTEKPHSNLSSLSKNTFEKLHGNKLLHREMIHYEKQTYWYENFCGCVNMQVAQMIAFTNNQVINTRKIRIQTMFHFAVTKAVIRDLFCCFWAWWMKRQWSVFKTLSCLTSANGRV